jgi:O-antigen/teichoic acid export membrane protein
MSTRRALTWSLAERYIGVLISIASTVILSRLLTPAQVGIYSMCAAVVAVASILRDFGVSEYIIQEKELTKARLRSAYGLAFVFAWMLGAAVFFSRNAIASYYNEPQVADVLTVLALHFLILPIASPTFALLNRELAFRLIFGVQLASNIAQSIVTVFMAWSGYGVMSLAWGSIVNISVQIVALWWLRPRDCMTLPGFREARHVLRFGSMFVASRTIEVLTRNFHEPVVAKQFDFASVGLLSRAFGLIDLFHNNIGAAVVRVATPAFAAQRREGSDLSTAFARATAIFASVSWAFFGYIAVMAEPVILVMFGKQWVAAAPLVAALAISTLPHGLFALAPQMLSATGHVSRRLRVSLIFSPIHIALILLAAQVSLLAVAWVWLVSNSLMMVMYLRHVRIALGIELHVLLRPALRSAAVVAGSLSALVVALWVIRSSGDSVPMQLIFGSTAWLIGWLVSAKLFSHPAYFEIKNLFDLARKRWATTFDAT